jgi:sulfatase modifying factor 1
MKATFLVEFVLYSFQIFACTTFSPAIANAATPAFQDVSVPAGNYYVGDVFGKQDYRGHANAVVSSYRIMKTEVTYALYRRVSDWGAQHGYLLDQGCEECYSSPEDDEKPVAAISWLGAAVWANALSEMTGAEPYYRDGQGGIIRNVGQRADIEAALQPKNDTGYRLPTLQEWHIAARGAMKALIAGTYGFRHSGGDNIDDVAWHADKARDTGPSRVGRLKPNQIGLHDMSGNVAEWTATSAEGLAASSDGKRSYYYFCGENWAEKEAMTLAACDFHSSGFTEGNIGFRLVRTVKAK